MAEPDHLHQLQQQRALVAQHLRWLDEQIARELAPQFPAAFAATPPALSAPSALHPVDQFQAPAAPIAASGTRAAFPVADQSVDPSQWLPEGDSADPAVSKTGCWVVFSAVLLICVGGSIWAIYAYYR